VVKIVQKYRPLYVKT